MSPHKGPFVVHPIHVDWSEFNLKQQVKIFPIIFNHIQFIWVGNNRTRSK